MKQGKRIGISSNSHKAIKNLLFEVAETCVKSKIPARFICTKDDGDDERIEDLGIEVLANIKIADAAVKSVRWLLARRPGDLPEQI